MRIKGVDVEDESKQAYICYGSIKEKLVILILDTNNIKGLKGPK